MKLIEELRNFRGEPWLVTRARELLEKWAPIMQGTTFDYRYRARVLRVVDGDTLHFEVDLGFDQTVKKKCRLHNINAPELNTEAGQAARTALVAQLPVGAEVTIRTFKDKTEKYGRYVVIVYDEAGRNMNDWLVENGYAVFHEY